MEKSYTKLSKLLVTKNISENALLHLLKFSADMAQVVQQRFPFVNCYLKQSTSDPWLQATSFNLTRLHCMTSLICARGALSWCLHSTRQECCFSSFPTRRHFLRVILLALFCQSPSMPKNFKFRTSSPELSICLVMLLLRSLTSISSPTHHMLTSHPLSPVIPAPWPHPFWCSSAVD